MSLLQALGSLFLGLVLWKIVKRITAPKRPSIDVAGPEKDHWLKGQLGVLGSPESHRLRGVVGNYHRLFQDGLEYNLRLIEKYGGAIKIHALLGVRPPRSAATIVSS